MKNRTGLQGDSHTHRSWTKCHRISHKVRRRAALLHQTRYLTHHLGSSLGPPPFLTTLLGPCTYQLWLLVESCDGEERGRRWHEGRNFVLSPLCPGQSITLPTFTHDSLTLSWFLLLVLLLRTACAEAQMCPGPGSYCAFPDKRGPAALRDMGAVGSLPVHCPSGGVLAAIDEKKYQSFLASSLSPLFHHKSLVS